MKVLWISLLVLSVSAAEEKPYLGAALVKAERQGRELVLVISLVPDSGADRAGVKPNDRILNLNGIRIESLDDVDVALENAKPGDEVLMRVKRGKRTLELAVVLGKTPPLPEQLRPMLREEIAGIFSMGRYWFGFEGMDISTQLAAKFGAKQGVLVNKVFEDGPARKAGLVAGDVVTGIEGRGISNQKEMAGKLEQYKKGSKVNLEIVRDHKSLVLSLELVSLRDVPKKYRKDLGNYLDLGSLIKGAIELGNSLEVLAEEDPDNDQ